MSLDLYLEDLKKQERGSPCYVSGMTFFVKRLGTKDAKLEIADIKEKIYGLFPKPKEIDENEIFANWLAYGGVVSWEGVTDDEDGKHLEYTQSFARQLFLNKSYWLSLNQALINHAVNYENYLADQVYEESEAAKKP